MLLFLIGLHQKSCGCSPYVRHLILVRVKITRSFPSFQLEMLGQAWQKLDFRIDVGAILTEKNANIVQGY